MGCKQENLVVNPGFDSGTEGAEVAEGWQKRADPHGFAYRLAGEGVRPGSLAQEMAGAGRGSGYVYQRLPVEAKATYHATGWIKVKGDICARLRLNFVDREYQLVNQVLSPAVAGEGSWTKVEVDAVPGPGAVELVLMPVAYSIGAGGRAWFDDVWVWRLDRAIVAPGARIPTTKAAMAGAQMSATSGDRPSATPREYRPIPLIIPRPKEVEPLPGWFVVGPATRIVVGDDADAADLIAARELNEELERLVGFQLPVLRAGELSASGNDPFEAAKDCIVLGESSQHPLINQSLEEANRAILHDVPGPQGYRLLATPIRIVVAGSDRQGTFYGVQTLKQLLDATESNGGIATANMPGRGWLARGCRVPAVAICDWPDHRFRGLHFCVDGYSPIFHTRLIDRVVARYKFNQIIAEGEMVQWESQPAIWQPEAASKADVAKVIDAARLHLVEINPLVQSLGHMEWLFACGANMDIVEDPDTPYAYNPLNPRSYQVILEIMDEAIDLFGARLLHIGHDEVRMRGRFPASPEGQKLCFAELFMRDTLRIARHLEERGVATMLWADVVLEEELALDLMRRSGDLAHPLVMVDWNYQPFWRFPSVDNLLKAGFPVIGSTWFEAENIHRFSRYAAERGVEGMLQTTWTGYFGNKTALEQELRQIVAYIVAAEFFWNSRGYAGPEDLPYDPGTVLAAAWER